MSTRPPTRSAFTIVELLVVVSVMALLIGILLPAMSSARKRSLKGKEMNYLRQVGHAWMLYANSNKDATLPGYLDADVQARWKVAYDFPDDTTVPPAPNFSGGDPNVAGPWTWRLMPYLDFSHQLIHEYRNEIEESPLAMIDEAEEIAYTPSFAYNALYIGGWWNMDGNDRPRTRYAGDVDANSGRRVSVVSRSPSSIRRSAEVITFCSAAFRLLDANAGWGEQTMVYKDVEDSQPGSHFVTPSVVQGETVWDLAFDVDVHTVQVFTTETDPVLGQVAGPAPVGRFTRQVAALFADGHVNVETPGSLLDQRMWIDAADREDFTHVAAP